jgi:uncharacterized membrane protein SirB2
MAAFYPYILVTHICAVLTSGLFFLVRGVATWLGASWPDNRKVKRLTYVIDSILLAAALLLVSILPSGVFANQWLTVKLVLVVTYIGLGIVSSRKQIPPLYRRIAFLLALFVFLNIVGIAVTHNPLGWWSLF